MNSLRTVWEICAVNFRKWRADSRVWCVGITLFLMVCMYADYMRQAAQTVEATMPLWIFPFLFAGFWGKIYFSLPIIILFCNAPFADRSRIFVITRTGRRKWVFGQILYVVLASAAYYAFILAASLLCMITLGGAGADWGAAITKLSTGNVLLEGANPVKVSRLIVYFFTPQQATAFTFLNLWLCGIFLGLLIFFLNSATGTRFAGVSGASLMVTAAVLPNFGLPDTIGFLPVAWTSLDNIDIGGMTGNPGFGYCIAVYLVLITVLSAAIIPFGGREAETGGL